MSKSTSYETVKLRSILGKPGLSETIKLLQVQMAKITKELPTEPQNVADEFQELADQANQAVRVAIASEKQPDDDAGDTNKALALVTELKQKLVLVPGSLGYRTGKKDGELEEGWNSNTQKYEFHHPKEWERLIERTGGGQMDGVAEEMINLQKQTGKFSLNKTPEELKDQKLGKTGVFVKKHHNQFVGTYEMHIRWERESTVEMRKGMTDNVNKREGEAKAGVKNACDMAEKLGNVINEHPELLRKGGLLNRIAGKIEGQGQYDVDPDKDEDIQKVLKEINEASVRLKDGKGQEGDANRIMQLVGCFTDGLTEVVEFQKGDKSKKTSAEQFETMWPTFQKAFGLKDEDKKKLLERVDGYKEIAGAVADTMSGKSTRKDATRKGKMPNDPRYKISDEDALIKNDISGSMHSSLLSQELSESLLGNKPIKGKGESVQVKDKSLIDARAFDALSLTAGGKLDNGTDLVLHTAYEMINGMRAITGGPEVDEAGASFIIRQMGKGASFTEAMELLFKPEQLPWLADQGEGSGKDSGGNKTSRPQTHLQKQMAKCEYRLSKEMDGSMYLPADILGVVSDTSSEIDAFEKTLKDVDPSSEKDKLTKQLDGVKDLQEVFVLSAMQRAAETLETAKKATVEEAGRIAEALKNSPDENAQKELFRSANEALLKVEGEIKDWVMQIEQGSELPGIEDLKGLLEGMVTAQTSLQESLKSLSPTL